MNIRSILQLRFLILDISWVSPLLYFRANEAVEILQPFKKLTPLRAPTRNLDMFRGISNPDFKKTAYFYPKKQVIFSLQAQD
jgi:hypothetical protein